MTTTKLSLSEVQKTLISLWGEPDLERYLKSGNLTDAQKAMMKLVPRDRMILYSDGIFAKRLQFSKSIYPATSKLFGKEWNDLVTRYWKDQRVNDSKPVLGLANFPQFLRDQYNEDCKNDLLIDLAEYELALALVTNCHNEIAIGKKSLPKSAATSKLVLAINPTLILRSFKHPVVTIAKQASFRRIVPRKQLEKQIHLIFYQDPATRQTRVQQIGTLAAKMILMAQSDSVSLSQLYRELLELMQDHSVGKVKAGFNEMIEQMIDGGIGILVPGTTTRIRSRESD